MDKQPINILDELDRVMTQISETQGDWDGKCECTDCYWNMYHPTKRVDNTQCVSESLCDTVMTPNTKDCPSYWSSEACGETKDGNPKVPCDLCKVKRANGVMVNKLNGNKLNVCWGCHKEVWGG